MRVVLILRRDRVQMRSGTNTVAAGKERYLSIIAEQVLC